MLVREFLRGTIHIWQIVLFILEYLIKLVKLFLAI